MGCSLSKTRKAPEPLPGQPAAPLASTLADTRHLRVKLVLLGDSGVGKTCIVTRFVRGSFDENSKVTVGAAFCAQTVALPELGTSVKFEVWDTAGQERYASLAPLYYRGAAAAAVVYDVTSGESFAKAHAWVKELKKHAAPGCVIALVGNKTDLDGREVSLEAGAAYAAEQALAFIETSAKSSAGVDALFTLIAQTCTQGGGGGGTAIGAEATAPPGAA